MLQTFFTQRGLKGHLSTQKALKHSKGTPKSLGHSRYLGTWTLEALGYSKETLALGHLNTRRTIGHSGTRGTLFSRLTWVLQRKLNIYSYLTVNFLIEFLNYRICTAHKKETIAPTFCAENLFWKKFTCGSATWKECNTKKVQH